ncbi:uncharacterized protein [Acropora muricata]|uniref:uncharacterized protein isoform X2 n=1 Tax=Acropora muricata TaxID=159855 RepID=UPI0034E3EF8A
MSATPKPDSQTIIDAHDLQTSARLLRRISTHFLVGVQRTVRRLSVDDALAFMDCLCMSRLLLNCIFLWSVAVLRFSDGSGITWHEPPPFHTVTNTRITSFTHKNLTQGFLNEELSCSFNLSGDMSLVSVWFELDSVTLASYFSIVSSPTVQDSFASRFNATWVPTRLTLVVFNVTRDDKGEYYCKVQALLNGRGKFWNRKIQVDVLVQSQITNVSGETVSEGGNVTLKCLPEGNPLPSFTWTRLSDNSVVTMPLTNVRRQDAGEYRCIAVNGVGKPASKDAMLVVEYPVEATASGGKTSVSEGDVKMLSCPVDGNPKPNIKWYNGSEPSGDPISFEEQLEAREPGCYTCVASNSLGPPVSIMQCLILNTTQEIPTRITNPTSTPISEGPPWTVIGIVVGVAVPLAIVFGLVTWWILKKRKCKEDTKRDLCYDVVGHLGMGDSLARNVSSEDQ